VIAFATCIICGRVGGAEPFALPALCSAECARSMLGPAGVAHLFPEIATLDEERALRANEQRILDGCLSRTNAHMAGAVAGMAFRNREEREEARRCSR
jgi:hypothetical protein